MDNRKWEADAIVSPPSAPASPSDGYPTNGDPGAGQNATEPGAFWFHAIGEELRAVIEAAGLLPEYTAHTQLYDALVALGLRAASEAQAGVVELATDAEAQAFTANKFIDGAKLATALKGSNQSLAASGYQKLPGGLILQWGTATLSSGGGATVTYPIAYPNSSLSTVATYVNSAATSAIFASISNLISDKTSFVIAGFNLAGSRINGDARWVSIGY